MRYPFKRPALLVTVLVSAAILTAAGIVIAQVPEVISNAVNVCFYCIGIK